MYHLLVGHGSLIKNLIKANSIKDSSPFKSSKLLCATRNKRKNTSTEEQTAQECQTPFETAEQDPRVTKKGLHATCPWMFAERLQVVIIERKLHYRSDRRWSCKTRQARGTPNRIVRCLAQQMNEKLFPSLLVLISNAIRPILPKYNNNFGSGQAHHKPSKMV